MDDKCEPSISCVTVKELSQILSIGRNSTYMLLQTGQLKSKKIGKKYIIPRRYIEEYLSEKH